MQDLSVGCGAYDRTWPLIAKTISVEGASLAWTILPREEVFLRGMLGPRCRSAPTFWMYLD